MLLQSSAVPAPNNILPLASLTVKFLVSILSEVTVPVIILPPLMLVVPLLPKLKVFVPLLMLSAAVNVTNPVNQIA